jgi:hypothetical protein
MFTIAQGGQHGSERARQSLDGLLAQLDLHGGRELTAALRFIAALPPRASRWWRRAAAQRRTAALIDRLS